MKMEELMYYNGIGGFSEDGKEYIIRVTNEERTPQPWSHILANKNFGTLLTSNGGGFTWYGNSRENKITSWRNDTTLDEASEKIILQDDYNKWSACSDNILEDESFDVVYGFGYAKYKLNSKRYEQQLDIYITENPYQKVSILRIKNLYNEPQKIDIKFMIHSVLGVAKEYTKKHIVKEFRNNYLKIYNKFNNDYSDYNVYLNIISIGNEQIKQENSNGFDGISIEIELKENEEKEMAFIIDYRKEEFEPKSLIYYKEQYEIEKEKWKEKLEKLQITTPVDSMNIMLNGWIMYQTIVSRILGRASFYQSGGAFGFRDQLQDMLSVLYIDDEMVKNQIIYHAKHQFEEGDVLHWWHPERNNGIRTRFSDDLLWLVYLACEYISFTGNFKFLLEEVNYTEGRLLKEDEQEVYIETKESEKKDELIIHCIKAINKSLDFGEHGLPKMGSGDWNDGMNMVGGESVWLGFFLADILKKFINIIQNEKAKDVIENIKSKIDIKNIIEKYETRLLELKKSLDEAWDGRWFKRAYFKTGEALGSNQNDECKIDNISQSWSVISGMATREKQETSMESVENYLADHENMFIKLLTPAFCNTSLEPGYIKSYIPGVRENGGQYTHGAIWAIIANCILNKNELATEYFRMLNPIEHSRTKEDVLKYKSEPYVIVADIYSHPHLIGRGGWSWYTGSASWYFVAGIKYILGLNKKEDYLEINPKIPKNWSNCYIKYKIENTEYDINIEKDINDKLKKENTNNEAPILYLDNEKQESNFIKINLDNKKHIIDVKL